MAGSTYNGRPLSEMTRDELIAVIEEITELRLIEQAKIKRVWWRNRH